MNVRNFVGFRTALAPLVALAGWVTPVNAQQFVPLPAGYMAKDVSADGEIVVGNGAGGGFIWRWRQDPAPTLIPGGSVVGTSDDGTVLAGTVKDLSTNWDTAAIWTQATGWQIIGGLASKCDSTKSTAYAISGDGTTVVGLAYGPTLCNASGFRWTAATGVQSLQVLASAGNRCSAISRDGSTMGGFAQGNFSRTPAYWNANLTGFVLNANYQGEVYGFNNDGSKSVGKVYGATPFAGAYVRDQQSGIMTNLGTLNQGWSGNATDISEDGNVIVGYDSQMLAIEAWVWTSSDGIISLNNRLAALGVTGVPPLGACTAVSDAGNVIVGGGGFTTGFIVELPSLVSFGAGTLGCTGVPALSGNPWPRVDTPTFSLTSTLAPPASLGLVMITDAADLTGSDPFGLGVQLHIDFFTSTETITLDATSDLFGAGSAPAAIPNNPFLIGKTYYAQVLWAWSFSSCFLSTFNLSTTQGLAITILP